MRAPRARCASADACVSTSCCALLRCAGAMRGATACKTPPQCAPQQLRLKHRQLPRRYVVDALCWALPHRDAQRVLVASAARVALRHGARGAGVVRKREHSRRLGNTRRSAASTLAAQLVHENARCGALRLLERVAGAAAPAHDTPRQRKAQAGSAAPSAVAPVLEGSDVQRLKRCDELARGFGSVLARVHVRVQQLELMAQRERWLANKWRERVRTRARKAALMAAASASRATPSTSYAVRAALQRVRARARRVRGQGATQLALAADGGAARASGSTVSISPGTAACEPHACWRRRAVTHAGGLGRAPPAQRHTRGGPPAAVGCASSRWPWRPRRRSASCSRAAAT